MPNWTDDTGYSWFGVLECKRCLGHFEPVDGEVPPHDCIGGRWKSISVPPHHHVAVPCKAGE